MKIIGEVEYKLIDIFTGEVLSGGPPLLNDIALPALRLWTTRAATYPRFNDFPTKRDSSSQSTSSGYHWHIYYGSRDCKQTKLNCFYPHDGSVGVNQDTPSWVDGATPSDPNVVTFTATIPAPVGSPRTIRVFGLDAISGGNSFADDLVSKFSLLRLTTPCVQDVNQILSVTYRLYIYPATSVGNSRVGSKFWNDFITIFKNMCTAVNSVAIRYNTIQSYIAPSAYKLDNLDTFAFGLQASTYTSSVPSIYQQTDFAAYSPQGVIPWVGYTNAMSAQFSWGVNDIATLGLFIKANLVVGAALAQGPAEYIRRTHSYDDPMPGVTSPLQNIFAQRNSPAGPFQDLTVNNSATMTGSITLDSTNWVDPDYQKMFKIRLTSSGDAGVSTYQVDVMNFVAGFIGNRWYGRTAILPQRVTDQETFRSSNINSPVYEQTPWYRGVAYRSPDKYRKVLAADMSRTQPGVTFYDVLSGSKLNLNASTTPALPITACSDGDVAKGYSFVACANTGLWRINPALDTVEHIPSPTGVDKAFLISVKEDAANTVWVLFEGGLCKLDNPDAAVASYTWTVYSPTQGAPLFSMSTITSGNNWNNVCAMVLNERNLSDDQFLFITATGTSSNSYADHFTWWNTGGAGAVNPTTLGVSLTNFTWTKTALLKQADSVRCAGGRWFVPRSSSDYTTGGITCFGFGANDLNSFSFGFGSAPTVCPATVNGIQGVFFTTMCQGVGGYASAFVKDANITTIPNAASITVASGYADFTMREGPNDYTPTMETQQFAPGAVGQVLAYLPGSNMVLSYETSGGPDLYGVTPVLLPPAHSKYATYSGAWWTSYGWDGNAWVSGNPGSRATHATLQPLPGLDGLQVSFQNGSSGTSFVNTEWFISCVGSGLMKDNGTVYTYRVNLHPEPAQRITISDVVPQAQFGHRVDEPVTFTPQVPNYSEGSNRPFYTAVQNKGTLVARASDGGGNNQNNYLVSDQLIGAGDPFDFRFKWICCYGTANGSWYKTIGLTSNSGNRTFGPNVRYNGSSGQLEVCNGTTVLATLSPPDPDTVCQFVRSSTDVQVFVGGVLQATITSSSGYAIMTKSFADIGETGWWDMKLTYDERRRVLPVGSNIGSGTGYYNANFTGLVASPTVGLNQVLIGSGSPLTAVMEYTNSDVALPSTGHVKVAAGAGWLIFHDSEPANAVSGYAQALYVQTLP